MTSQLTRQKAGTNLLRKLTASPALPAWVRSLQAPVLKRLVDQIGVADATEIIVHSTTSQMQELFEVVLWESLEPGRPESHRPEKFLEWADAMLGAGEAFTAHRLIELGEDFITQNLAPLVAVYESDLLASHDDEGRCECITCRFDARDVPWDQLGDYVIAAEHADEWDTVRTLIMSLDDADSRCLQRILARCCRRAISRGFSDDGQHSAADAAAERQQKRESTGYVTPELAAVFLRTTRTTDSETLLREARYDDITAQCFRARTAHAAKAESPEASTEKDDEPSPSISDLEQHQLDTILREGEVIAEIPLLLAAPQNTNAFVPELQTHLDRLQWTDSTAFMTRLSELVHLANVLVAGARFKGNRFTEPDAARAALSCANLGLDLWLTAQNLTRHAERRDAIENVLMDEPGVVKLFRIGWQTLQALPRRCGHALIEALQDPHLRGRLSRRAWILAEIDSAISDPDLLGLIDEAEFEDVSDNLHLLTLILDQRACRCLQTLITDWPQYPVQLETGLEHAKLDNPEVRNVSTVRHLERIERFLEDLHLYLKIDA